MRVFECPQRDMELRTNEDEDLPSESKFCPTHYVPLFERKHPVGQCLDREDVDPFGNRTKRCLLEPGAQAYDKGAK